MSSKHDDSDSDIFGIAAQHVDGDDDDDDDVGLQDTSGQHPVVADIYPPDKSFRVQDPKQNPFKNFHSIERVFSGDSGLKNVPAEIGVGVQRASSIDQEDISDDDSSRHVASSTNSKSNPNSHSKPVTQGTLQNTANNVTTPMKPPTHPRASPHPAPVVTAMTSPQPPAPSSSSPHPSNHQHRGTSPVPSIRSSVPSYHPSRSPSPSRESGVRFSIADHQYSFGHYSPSVDQQSESATANVRPISPQSHLLSTTRARVIDHDLAHEQLQSLHPHNRQPKERRNTIQVQAGANFLRPTEAYKNSTDFQLELERRQEKRDIWWEERRREVKAPASAAMDNVKSRLYEPTLAYKESLRSPHKPQGTVSRDISPTRSLSGVKTKSLSDASPLLKSTKASQLHAKITTPPPAPPSPRLSLLGQQSYPQQHQVTSKLAQETTAVKMAKWKMTEQVQEEEKKRYLEQKNAKALAAHSPLSGAIVPVASPVRSPSERLMSYNTAMSHQARTKAATEGMHNDPQDQGPGWNALFTRDRIDSEPFRSRSPSPSSRMSRTRSVSPSSAHSTPSHPAQSLPPAPPSALKKPRHSSGGMQSEESAAAAAVTAEKTKRVSLTGVINTPSKTKQTKSTTVSPLEATNTSSLPVSKSGSRNGAVPVPVSPSAGSAASSLKKSNVLTGKKPAAAAEMPPSPSSQQISQSIVPTATPQGTSALVTGPENGSSQVDDQIEAPEIGSSQVDDQIEADATEIY